MKSIVANGKRLRQNEKDFGVANLEPVERDKYSGFSVNRVSEDKRDPRKHVNTITSREVTSALELRAKTTSLLVPLPDHKRKRRKEKKRKKNKYSLKTFSSFPLFFLISDFPPLRKFTTCKRELLNIQIQVDALLFYKNCLNFRCSLFVLF